MKKRSFIRHKLKLFSVYEYLLPTIIYQQNIIYNLNFDIHILLL